jgi:hypothetical protein
MLIVRQSSLKSGPVVCIKVSSTRYPAAVRFFPMVFTAGPPPKLLPDGQDSPCLRYVSVFELALS